MLLCAPCTARVLLHRVPHEWSAVRADKPADEEETAREFLKGQSQARAKVSLVLLVLTASRQYWRLNRRASGAAEEPTAGGSRPFSVVRSDNGCFSPIIASLLLISPVAGAQQGKGEVLGGALRIRIIATNQLGYLEIPSTKFAFRVNVRMSHSTDQCCE